MYASQNKRAASLRCSEAANTLSVALEQELTNDKAYERSYIWKYLRFNLLQNTDVTWPYYKPDEDNRVEAYRYFNLKDNKNYNIDGFPGEIKLCMYWTLPDDSILEDDKISSASIDERSGCYLYIDIICNSGSQSYSVTNKYRIDISEFDMNDDEDKHQKSTLNTDSTYSEYNPMSSVITYNNTEKWVYEFEGRE